MNSELECVAVSSIEEARRLATGEVNKESPHLTVPFFMPLAPTISHEAALKLCSPELREAVESGKLRLLAVAQGTMAEHDSSSPVQFVLMQGKVHDHDPNLFLVLDCREYEVEAAVLMDGDGLRCRDDQPLSQEEAVGYWMGGFLGWNEKCPGLYRLRYAPIEQ